MTAAKVKPESTGAEIVPIRQREPLPDEVVLAIAAGDLAPLTAQMRAVAIRTICEDGNLPVSLSPVILMPGKDGQLKPYVTAIGASWVADNKRVSTKVLGTSIEGGVYIVRMLAIAGDGRSVEDIGAVAVQGLGGQYLADAYMKGHTKAYRRTVLRLAGLPLTDDDEGSGPPRRIDYETGEIIEAQGTIVSSSTDGQKPDAARSVTSKRLYATIRDTFGKDEDASAIGHDLVCIRFGLGSTKDATMDQLREAVGAVESWRGTIEANKRLSDLQMVGSAETYSIAVDLRAHFDETSMKDVFVRAALDEILARFERQQNAEDATDAAIGKVVDAAMAS